MLDPHKVFHAMFALNALLASLAWCLARPNWASILAVVVSAALWPAANEVFERRILVVLTPEHGITTYDLLSVVCRRRTRVRAAIMRTVPVIDGPGGENGGNFGESFA